MGDYTSRQIIDGAAKWGIGVDEYQGGPGRVGLIQDGRLLALIPHPSNPNPSITKYGDLMRGLMAYVHVGHPDQFLYGPVMEARPFTEREQPMSGEDIKWKEGYVPMKNRPALPAPTRQRSVSAVVEQVVCYLDEPVTAAQVYEETVKYVPYIGLENVAAALNNMANGAVHSGHVKRYGYIPNPDYGVKPKAQQQLAVFVVDPPFRINEEDILRLPDWRPRGYKPRGKNNKQQAKPKRPDTLKEQQRRAAERRAKDAQRKAVREAERKLEEGKPLTPRQAEAIGQPELASQPPDGRFVNPAAFTVHEPVAQQYPAATFTAVARTLEDPNIIILRDDQGQWWEARLSADQHTYNQ